MKASETKLQKNFRRNPTISPASISTSLPEKSLINDGYCFFDQKFRQKDCELNLIKTVIINGLSLVLPENVC